MLVGDGKPVTCFLCVSILKLLQMVNMVEQGAELTMFSPQFEYRCENGIKSTDYFTLTTTFVMLSI